ESMPWRTWGSVRWLFCNPPLLSRGPQGQSRQQLCCHGRLGSLGQAPSPWCSTRLPRPVSWQTGARCLKKTRCGRLCVAVTKVFVLLGLGLVALQACTDRLSLCKQGAETRKTWVLQVGLSQAIEINEALDGNCRIVCASVSCCIPFAVSTESERIEPCL